MTIDDYENNSEDLEYISDDYEDGMEDIKHIGDSAEFEKADFEEASTPEFTNTAEFEALTKDSIGDLVKKNAQDSAPVVLTQTDIDSLESYLSGFAKRGGEYSGADEHITGNEMSRLLNKDIERKKRKKPKMNYDDYDEDTDETTAPKKRIIFSATILMTMVVCIMGMLVFKINAVNKELEDIKGKETSTNQQTVDLKTYNQVKTELEQAKVKNTLLESELADARKTQNVVAPDKTDAGTNKDANKEETDKDSEPGSKYPAEYIVKKGDSLWKISEKIYGNGDYYTEIMKANNIKDANSIYAGLKLKIPVI